MPKDETKERRFLGLATYMRKYETGFAKIAAPMTDLLKGKIKIIT